MKKPLLILFPIILFFNSQVYPDVFEELDKAPEGAHRGQMLLSAFVSYGFLSRGDIIDAEDKFLENSTYTFENDETKALQVSHNSISFGASFEYMPIDYLGLKTRIRRSYIVQKSNFGRDYENFRGYVYKDYAFTLGPSIHSTYRKRWDFTLTPMIGYSYGNYSATPVAADSINNYSGKRKKTAAGTTYGAEINFTAYFTGGFYMSMGVEWVRNKLSWDSPFDLTNPQTGNRYFEGKTSGYIDSYSIIISPGYAFSN